MDCSEYMKEYYTLLQAQSEAENRLKMFEMRVKLELAMDQVPENQRFILDNPGLDDEDREFLQNETCSYKEIAEHVAQSVSWVRKFLKTKQIEAQKVEGSREMQVSTVAVIKALGVINGEPNQKQKRSLDTRRPIPWSSKKPNPR